MRKKAILPESSKRVTVQQVLKALQAIQALTTRREKKRTFSAIANILKHSPHPEFSTIHRVTVSRWLRHTSESKVRKIHKFTYPVILLAAQTLREWDAKPEVLRCGLIKHATEFIPLHILVHMAGDNHKELGGMQVEAIYMNSVDELVAALQEDKVDCIAAPRHFFDEEYHADYTDIEKHPVRRFFKIATIKPQAIFTFPKTDDETDNTDDETDKRSPTQRTDYDVQKVVRKLSTRIASQRIGVLPNVGYNGIIEAFAEANNCTVLTHPVANYQKAYEAFRDGTIVACVGHPVFIENTFARVKNPQEQLTDTQKRRLQGLEIVKEPPFDEVKVEIFVNLPIMAKEERRNLAPMLLHALYQSMEYIDPKKRKTLSKTLNDILRLENAPKYDASAIFDTKLRHSYRFAIETFPVQTLRELWKWKPVLRVSESQEV